MDLKFKGSKKGQVAVEFVMMFVLVISVIIYAFYFAVSFTALHYRSYEVFMIGRAILSSAKTYNEKGTYAAGIQAQYDSAAVITTVSKPTCDMDLTKGPGFRGIMDYGYPANFSIFSNAGIACSVNANYLLPSLITRSNGNQLQVAIESMTGSEISNKHSECAMDPTKTWEDCITEGQSVNVFADNKF